MFYVAKFFHNKALTSVCVMQFKPTIDEQWVIRSLLDAQEAFILDTDFIIEEGPDGEPLQLLAHYFSIFHKISCNVFMIRLIPTILLSHYNNIIIGIENH